MTFWNTVLLDLSHYCFNSNERGGPGCSTNAAFLLHILTSYTVLLSTEEWIIVFSPCIGRYNATINTLFCSLQAFFAACLCDSKLNLNLLWKKMTLSHSSCLKTSVLYIILGFSPFKLCSTFPHWCSLSRRLLPWQRPDGRRRLWLHDNWLPPPTTSLASFLGCHVVPVVTDNQWAVSVLTAASLGNSNTGGLA